MIRHLSYLTDATLDRLLSIALAAARRHGGHYDNLGCWNGKRMPHCIFHLIDEYVWRNQR